jgi:hypothetical protein
MAGGDMTLVNHKLRAAFRFMALALLSACGDGSSPSNGNADGGGPGGGPDTGPDCQLPACYYDFVNSVQVCVPKGTCIQQDDITPTGPVMRLCYANGAKVIINNSLDGMSSANITYGPDGKICYLLNGTLKTDPMTGVISLDMAKILNADGNVIATINADRSMTANCAGEPTKTVAASCNVPLPSNADSQCTFGTCM